MKAASSQEKSFTARAPANQKPADSALLIRIPDS